jgi:hypothetical protein
MRVAGQVRVGVRVQTQGKVPEVTIGGAGDKRDQITAIERAAGAGAGPSGRGESLPPVELQGNLLVLERDGEDDERTLPQTSETASICQSMQEEVKESGDLKFRESPKLLELRSI